MDRLVDGVAYRRNDFLGISSELLSSILRLTSSRPDILVDYNIRTYTFTRYDQDYEVVRLFSPTCLGLVR